MQQMQEAPVFKQENFAAGVFLILQVLFKKVVLGDNMGAIVAQGFNHVAALPLADAWLATAGFTFQIFFDFAGYTDIGRGSALLFGYKVPENFNLPFLAANLTDFWRRWHISLSTWLRDYLFIPMGGSRGGAWKVRRNMMITMVLGGLWHGAAWHYVIWGASPRYRSCAVQRVAGFCQRQQNTLCSQTKQSLACEWCRPDNVFSLSSRHLV